jgi:invasion protein IalB
VKLSIPALAVLISIVRLSADPAAAQTQKPPPKAAEPAPPTTTAAPPAPPAAKIRRTETVVDDNWTVTCAETDQPNTKPRCVAQLKIVQTENNTQRVIFTWVIGAQAGKPVSVLSMPSGVRIPPGVQVSAGDKEIQKVSFSICQPDHCEAVIPMDEALVKTLSAAPTTDVTVYAVNGNAVKFSVNMKGFEQALPAVIK